MPGDIKERRAEKEKARKAAKKALKSEKNVEDAPSFSGLKHNPKLKNRLLLKKNEQLAKPPSPVWER